MEFTGRAIVVKVRHAGEFTEFIPLLQRGDESNGCFHGEDRAAGFLAE